MTDRAVTARVGPSFLVGAGALTITLEETGDSVVGPTEQIASLSRSFGWRSVRVYPGVGANVVTARGELENTGALAQNDRDEFIVFSGSDTAQTAYPIDAGSLVVDEVFFALDEDGDPIPLGSLSFRSDPNTNSIIANRPFFGTIQARYSSTAEIYRYRPLLENATPANGYIAYLRAHGPILAFKDGAATTLEMLPLGFGDAFDENVREVYRVVSSVQVNADGAWEVHPSFQSGGSWGGNAPSQGSAFFEYERVHEIGYLRATGGGILDRETRNTEREQGPTGTFTPEFVARFRAASDFQGTEFFDAYSALDLDLIRSQIQSRFGLIEGTV